MFTVGSRRATLLPAEGFELIELLTRTEPSLNAFKHGCRFMQSTYECLIKTTFGQLDQKFILESITEITFGPLDQRWSFFDAYF